MKLSPNAGLVLQGYFRAGQSRSAVHIATGVQSMLPPRPAPALPRPDLSPLSTRSVAAQFKPVPSVPGVPRPDLLPVQMRGIVGQPQTSPPRDPAPRPELLPGMGAAVVGGLRVVAQARAIRGVSATPLSASQLREIGEGRPLESNVRQAMEAFFQADFSSVRVHEGPTARGIGALAFTLGEEIHFAPGWYEPASREGIELIGHELAHVMQQRKGRVNNPYGRGVAIVQDPELEAEAERMGQRAAAEVWSVRFASQQSLVAQAQKRRRLSPRSNSKNSKNNNSNKSSKSKSNKSNKKRKAVPVISDLTSGELQEPKLLTAPRLESYTGRSGSTRPLTDESYELLKDKLEALKARLKNKKSYKLGFRLPRARIPRIIASKMTDLTESYSKQMKALSEAAKQPLKLYGQELEGRFEKTEDMAKRFQGAMEDIEKLYDSLKRQSKDIVDDIVQGLPRRSGVLRSRIFKNYEIDPKTDCPKLILLPLIKGKDVYSDKQETLTYLLEPSGKTDRSSERASSGETEEGTQIEIVYQVPPEFESRIFSDHAGFVAQFSANKIPDLFVYYHSLEHGHQHTDTRTNHSFGSHPGFGLYTKGKEIGQYPLHNPRSAYMDVLEREMGYLGPLAKKGGGDLLIIIGECTSEVDKRVRDLLKKNGYKPSVFNVNKEGLGVHAFMAYLVGWSQDPPVLEPHLLTLPDGTEQNLLTVTYNEEKHAFAHLLNKKEDALAKALKDDGYVSVGGDLNNIKSKKELVQTINRERTRISIGSNSVSDKMYDKIVLL